MGFPSCSPSFTGVALFVMLCFLCPTSRVCFGLEEQQIKAVSKHSNARLKMADCQDLFEWVHIVEVGQSANQSN